MTEFTLCEDTAALAVRGACPKHGGDACLKRFAYVGLAGAAVEAARAGLAVRRIEEYGPSGDGRVEHERDREYDAAVARLSVALDAFAALDRKEETDA